MIRRRLLLLAIVGHPSLSLAGLFNSSDSDWADVVVVGSGAAGLSCAVTAAQAGLKVVLLEKEPTLGGSTLISGGYFTVPQGPSDSASLYLADMLKSGRGLSEVTVVRRVAEGATEAFQWLQSQGIRFEPGGHLIYGSIRARCRKPIVPRGASYVQALSASALSNGVRIITEATMQDLVEREGRIAGVIYNKSGQSRTLWAKKGVVLATGGYGAGKRLLAKYVPEVAGLPCDTSPTNTGEALEIAQRHGASLVNMDQVECVPESANSPEAGVHVYTHVRGLALIDETGARFVDEMLGRTALARAILARKQCFAVVDNENVNRLDRIQKKNLYRALYAGTAWRADTLESLAKAIGVDDQTLVASVTQLPEDRRPCRPPFWAYRVQLWIHYTMGGLRISPEGACVGKDGQPIPGLYAAGQATGNIHGANRLGGNGLTDAVVFGRICGQTLVQSQRH